MKRLRLVKIVAQAHYVIDDGDTLTEAVGEQFTVTAQTLDTFPASFRDGMAVMEMGLNEDAEVDA